MDHVTTVPLRKRRENVDHDEGIEILGRCPETSERQGCGRIVL